MSDDLGSIPEAARQIPVRWEADVVVCGGGPAGTAAAIASARQGASTILLERYGCLGGLATGGLVLFLPSLDLSGQPLIGGIGRETRDRLLASGEAAFRREAGPCMFDPEALKWLSVRMCREAGVEILHHVWVAAAHVQKGQVHGVIVQSKAGRLAVRGKAFVDATGDGDVFASAGAEFEVSDQDIGLPFRLTNVDRDRWEQARERDPEAVSEAVQAVIQAGGWTGHFGLTPMPRPDGFVWANTRLKRLNGLDPEHLTEIETEGREAIRRSVEALRANVPGFEDAWLVDTASQLGVRRTRRLVGEYVLTDEDLWQADRRFSDAVGRGTDFRQQGSAFDIPYGCLLPREIGGLLTAGRCLSCSDGALEPLREIRHCWVTGQAAGTAAAMAAAVGCSPREVPVPDLQASLRAAGVALAQ